MDCLPNELIDSICSYLTADDLCTARLVTKRWHDVIVHRDLLWKRICKAYNLMDYEPPETEVTPIDHYCYYARVYLMFRKRLRTNFTTNKRHILPELSSIPTVDNVFIHKSTFVRTYIFGDAVDIFQVDKQCVVQRKQKIETRYPFIGSDFITLSDDWLAVSRLNATSVYRLQPNGEYLRMWIILFSSDDFQYIYCTDEDSDFEMVEDLLGTNEELKEMYDCIYVSDDYVWFSHDEAVVIVRTDYDKGVATIFKTFQTFGSSLCCDDFGFIAYNVDNKKFVMYDAFYKKFHFQLNTLVKTRCLLTMNRYTYSFVTSAHGSDADALVLSKRHQESSKDITINGTNSILSYCLHPSKNLVYIIWASAPASSPKFAGFKCYSTDDGLLLRTIMMDNTVEFSPRVYIGIAYNLLILYPLSTNSGILICNDVADKIQTTLLEPRCRHVHSLVISDMFRLTESYERGPMRLYVECFL